MGILDVLGLRVAKDEDMNEEPVYGRRNEDLDEEMMFDGEESYGEEEFDDEPYYEERPRFGGLRGRDRERERHATSKIASMPTESAKIKVLIYKPISYEDTQNIIDNLKEKKSIVVNLDDLEIDVAQRILDFISGAVYALNGSIRKAARNIFVIAPFNVDVSSNSGDSQSGSEY